ncbi:MAG TPA: GTPase Era [Alphaproteobacteria bacterium]|nr:GTPase Era [Alphaproteobacteria bacterium]
MQKCAFITLLGIPNAGKSTLLNALVGEKVSIVSPKVQTTRQRILGIAMQEETQLIFVDTPGLFEPKRRLERAMVEAAWTSYKESDLNTFVIDLKVPPHTRDGQNQRDLLEKVSKDHLIIVMNKIDLLDRPTLLSRVEFYTKDIKFQKAFMISALKSDGIQDFKDYLATLAPASPWLYPEDELTDMPLKLWVAEFTREQLYTKLRQELPYETFVETENLEHFDNGSIKINQVIYVAKEGQKAILLGHKGEKIKSISTSARFELEKLLDRPVHLFLHVKVVENWMEKKRNLYNLMGLNF